MQSNHLGMRRHGMCRHISGDCKMVPSELVPLVAIEA